MVFFAGSVSVILVALIAYFAISKQTSRAIKIAARIALIVIGLVFAGCAVLLFILGAPAAGKGAAYGDFPVIPEKEPGNQDLLPMLIFALIVLVIIALVIFISLRGQKRIQEGGKTTKPR
jgi:cytochrome bd-type quinol oxidase subunit 2